MSRPPTDEIVEMIADCANRQSQLSEWESKFIDGLWSMKHVSDKQYEILRKIWERVT